MISDGKLAMILITTLLFITFVDSQFINLFYATGLGSPSNLNLILFISFVVVALIINIFLLKLVKSNNIEAKTTRPTLFKVVYFGTLCVQCILLMLLVISTLEMIVLHHYNKQLSLLITYFSHIWSAIVLGFLTLNFVQWLKFSRSYSIIVYAIAYSIIVLLIILTIPILTEQVNNQSALIYPLDYTTLVVSIITPSPDVSFLYAIGGFVLPLMILVTWTITVSFLKSYINKIGRLKFWLIVSIPLFYEFLTFVVKNTNLITDPNLVQIIYSQQFQFVFAISYQVSGLFFAIAYFNLARKMKQKAMKTYLMISAIGIATLLSSIQPGLPFYAAYPPFGTVTVSYLGLSSYLLLVGMLGSATYLSRDSELRKEIYRNLELDSTFLRNIGMAEMQREIERKILPLHQKIDAFEERKGIAEFDEAEIKMVINDVINELHSKKSDVKLEK